MPNDEKPPKVFISYSHDSQEHRLRVYELLRKLRADGIHCVTDHTLMSPGEGWQAWMEDRIKEADFTLVVCTETYRRRAERKEQPGVGLGVMWETTLITSEIYQNASRNTKFIPVLFTQEDVAHRPQVSYYRVDLEDGYELLLRHLTNQPLFEDPPIAAKVRSLPPINRQEDFDDMEIEAISNEVIAELSAKSSKPKAVQLTSNMNLSEDLGNDIKLAMMAIPGGSFLMGSDEYDNEKPIHQVTLSPFRMGKYQVTQAQWRAVMGNNPSLYKGDDPPVEHVSWKDASSFCQKLTEKTGREYRLPTEAEWEYACRAGSTGRYCFGDNNALLQKYAWYRKNAGDKTHPVGEKLANDWGLHDMHGNVWEWCRDWYDEDYYWESLEENPQGPSSGTHRVLRGGSFNHDKDQCGSANRGSYTPDTIYRYLGFRVVCVARTS
jgi:formylglycine-generating enzyme required for sulfatase activity